MHKPILLGVNIDHIATLRQARHTLYPDPIQAAFLAEQAGADGITVHLREDRRHIQQRDVDMLMQTVQTHLNLEMAVTDEMIQYALKCKPHHCCFVPEKRAELTTEGGLDLVSQESKIKEAVKELQRHHIQVSLFIDPDVKQIEAASRCLAEAIEIHTGCYAEEKNVQRRQHELERIMYAVNIANEAGLIINAGHGLNYQNVQAIAAMPQINELNIGHAIIARAMMTGMSEAVSTMKTLMIEARIG